MTLLFITIGIGAGVLSGLFGVGGGIIIVPALAYFAKMPAHQAVGTSLGALMLPLGAAVGATTYYKAGNVDVRASVLIALGLAAGAWFGAQISLQADAATLRKAFAVFLVLVAGKLWFN